MMRDQIISLSTEQLGELNEALLEFSEVVDLDKWLINLGQRANHLATLLDEQFGESFQTQDPKIAQQVFSLSLVKLARLEEAIAQFTDIHSLEVWLERQANPLIPSF